MDERKGRALLTARKLLGPMAHVAFKVGDDNPCKVGVFDGHGAFKRRAVGKTWGEAFTKLADFGSRPKLKRQRTP